jgi:hypothetical protein
MDGKVEGTKMTQSDVGVMEFLATRLYGQVYE